MTTHWFSGFVYKPFERGDSLIEVLLIIPSSRFQYRRLDKTLRYEWIWFSGWHLTSLEWGWLHMPPKCVSVADSYWSVDFNRSTISVDRFQWSLHSSENSCGSSRQSMATSWVPSRHVAPRHTKRGHQSYQLGNRGAICTVSTFTGQVRVRAHRIGA